MSENKELLSEAEKVDKVVVCVSSLIYYGLGSNYPGLNALFFLRLRLIGIDPQTGIVDDPENYLKALVQLVGNEKSAEQLLRSVLPRKKVFDEVLRVLLSSHSKSEIETLLLNIVRKYEKELKTACKEMF